MTSVLFNTAKIKNIHLRNRFVRSATFENMATPDGKPIQKLKELYNNLADGGVGLIVTGLAQVESYKNLSNVEGIPLPLAIDEDRFIDEWREIIRGVHKRGAKIAMQVSHPGRQDIPHIREPIAPSAVKLENIDIVPREMTIDEIHYLIEKFAQSCRCVKEAGFDAVQLHGCHGYLISNFISPYFNIRKDGYGGSTENRARFIKEIVEKARKLIGPEFTIMIKMNFNDFIKGGINSDEAIEVAKIIVQSGIDAIEVTGGISSHNPLHVSARRINREEDEAYFQSYSKALKKHISVPVLLVGGIRSLGVSDRLLKSNTADFISMCRPFICEPGLIKRWKEGDTNKAKCISCNKCRENLSKRSVRCYINESFDDSLI